MTSKETIYHMAADIYASGHATLKEAAQYAVKLAGLVDVEIERVGDSKNKVTPKCFLTYPNLRQRAENGCLTCKFNDACFSDLAKK